ncbi:MAG: MFS transporter, partial [Erysipelotrichaceae bacterium]
MNIRKVIWIGFGFLTISLFWQMYDLTIPLILKDVFQLPDTLSGMVMSFDNVFALLLLPLVGVWSDRLQKRRPFILVGTLLAVFWLVWLPLTIYYESVVLFLVLLGLAVASLMLYRTPLIALMPDHVPEKQRSNANAILNFLGSIGTLAALWVVQSNLPQGHNYTSLFLSIALLLLLGSAVVLTNVKEGTFSGSSEVKMELMIPKRSLYIMLLAIFLWFMGYNAVTSGFSKYAVYYLEMSGNRFV